MPIRRPVRVRFAAAALFAVGTACLALGQTPQPVPKYYPGTVTPHPNNAQTYGSPSPKGQPGGARPAPGGAVPAQPRLTQPVVAGPGGVRPVSASDADLSKPLPPTGDLSKPLPPTGDLSKPLPPTGELAKPAFFPQPSVPPTGDLPKPSVPPVPGPGPTPQPVPLPVPVPLPAGADPLKPPTVVTERTAPPVTPLPAGPGNENPLPPTTPPTRPAVSTPPLAANLSSRAAPAVSVEMDAPESVGVGHPCTYTLVVRNTGTAAVSGVRVDHELPTGVTFGGSEPAAENAGDGRLVWAVGNLDAGAEKRIKVTVTPSDEGEFRGRAAVTFAAGVETRVKVTRPRIAVTLTGPDVTRVGEPVVFNVKLTNTGSGPAGKLRLHARFTDGLKHKNGQVIEGTMANLEAGGTKTFPLEVAAARPGQETFVLSVFADANQPETAKAAVTLVEPQLVAKQTGPARCLVRAEPVFQIDLTNPGSAATDALRVWTAVPDGFEFVSATDGGALDAATKSVVWRLGALAPQGAKQVSVKLRAVAPADATVRTTVQAGGEGEPVRAKPLEARAETAVRAEGVAALRFDLIGQDGLVEVGKETVYEIKVVNHGTGPCTNVQLVAELADGTTMLASAGPTNGRGQGQTVLFEPLPQLAVRGEAVYRMRVKGTQPGDMRFRVKLMCDQIKTPVVKEENTKFYKE